MNAQPATSEHIRLTDEQLARLEAAVIGRPARTFIDRDGITRTTQVYINQFVSNLVKFHKAHGYLTARQVGCVKHILEAKQ